MTPDEVTPFRIEVPQDALGDLRGRLGRTRWPEAETVDDWSQGVPLSYLRELCRHWAEDYDWWRCQARLNAVPQYTTDLDGLDDLALSAPPGADGVVLVPYFEGERTPNRPDATAHLSGLRVAQSRGGEGLGVYPVDPHDAPAYGRADVSADAGRLG